MIKEITQNEFDEILSQEKEFVIDFFATWCGPCKTMSRVIEAFADENPDTLVLKVDVDECNDIASRFAVMSIPTVVVMRDGAEVARKVGVASQNELENMVFGDEF